MSDISKVPMDRVEGLQTQLSTKQDVLIAGANIIIGPDNTISAISGSGAPTLLWYTNKTGTKVTITEINPGTEVSVYKNGILLQPTEDYTISGTKLTLTTALIAADKIALAVYSEAESLSLKANVTLNNITTIDSTFSSKLNSAGIVTVVQTYHSGNDWYRIWSDGWCEQGGDLILDTSSYTFLVNYSAAPRVITQVYTNNNMGATNAGAAQLPALPTTTGFTTQGTSSTYYEGGWWVAYGYTN